MSDFNEIKHLTFDLGFTISYYYRKIDGTIIVELSKMRYKSEEIDTEVFCIDCSHPEYTDIEAFLALNIL